MESMSQHPVSPTDEEIPGPQQAEDSLWKKEPLQGEVREFREFRHPEGNFNPVVWTFRLERIRDGVPITPIMVEMRGVSFSGFINEGDTVALYDTWQEGTLLNTKRVYNKTAGIEVKALTWFEAFWESLETLAISGSPVAILFKALLILVLIMILISLCFAAYVFFQVFPGLQDFNQEFCRLAPLC